MTDRHAIEVLNHIHSLGVISQDQARVADLAALLRAGLIRQVWIGAFALTEEGRQTRREYQRLAR